MTQHRLIRLPQLTVASAVLAALLAVASLQAIQTCTSSYCVGSCSRNCSDPELGGATTTCENWLIQNDIAGDSDGIANTSDNCVCTNNSNQANCDGDAKGDACDTFNGNFVPVDRWIACASDIDQHVGYYTAEVEEDRQYEDTSACNSADRWDRRILSSYCLYSLPEQDCCESTCSNGADLFICDPIGSYQLCHSDTIP